jgi:hypothetical protein
MLGATDGVASASDNDGSGELPALPAQAAKRTPSRGRSAVHRRAFGEMTMETGPRADQAPDWNRQVEVCAPDMNLT